MTKAAEMRSPIVWTCVALVSLLASIVTPYLEGRSNSWWVIPPMLPAEFLPILLLFVSCLVLLSRWIRSVVAKRHAVATALMFFLALLLFTASFSVRSADLFLSGLADFAKGVLTADEWRSISQFAQDHPLPEGRLPGPRKNLWNETKHRALWSAFAAATQIQKLDPSLMIFVSPEDTEIAWGGALVGHRGLMIYTSKHGGNQHGALPHSMFIAEDIVVFITPD